MRVLYFSRGYTPHDHRFLSALATSPHEVAFLQLDDSVQTDDRPLPTRVERLPWRGAAGSVDLPRALALRGALRRVFQRLKPDVVHAGPVQHCAFLTAMAGFHPLVTMSWGSDLLRDAASNRSMQWKTQFTLRRTDVLVGDCQAVANQALEYGVPPEDIVLFPWGVDLQHFHPYRATDFRRRLGWDDCFVLLSLRAWEPLYGVEELLRGFVAAARQIPELRLLLLGGGSQAALLRRILLEAQMLDRVHFGGQVKQASLPAFYQAADLYISASHSDGSSVSLMEALASGLPVLVSDIPGNREWVEDGVHGWFFPVGDAQAICDGIRSAWEQRERLQVLGKAARALAERRADWPQNFARLLHAYELALAKKEQV